MKFENFTITASPKIIDAYCKCRSLLKEIPDGWFSIVLFCPKCEDVYMPTLKKITSKVGEEGINTCKKYLQKTQEKKGRYFKPKGE